MRLIDADHLRKWILARWEEAINNTVYPVFNLNPIGRNEREYPLKAIEILDQIDREDTYEEVHGRWISTGFLTAKCSVCDAEVHELEYGNYCPNCGAKMDEVEE